MAGLNQRWVPRILLVFLIVLGLRLWQIGCILPSNKQFDFSNQINPDKKYTVLLWDFDRPLPAGASYREELQREIQAFNKSYPNIRVELRLFRWDQEEEVIAAIKRRQDLPDVLATGPLTDLAFADEILLSDSYLAPEDKREYVPLALASIALGPDIAVWPRYLAPQLYLANRDYLQAAGLATETRQQEGLAWEDFLALGEKLYQLPQQPFVLASFDYQGLLAAVAPRQLDKVGESLISWPASVAPEAVKRVQELYQRGYLPPTVCQEGYLGLQDFFSGRAALLTPAEPWLLRMVSERTDRLQRGLLAYEDAKSFPVVLVPPRLTPTSGLPVRTEGLVVFKRRAADEIKAAAMVASYLSKSGTLPAQLDLLPAYRPAQEAWSQAWRWGNESVLLTILEHPIALMPYPYTELEGKDT